MSTQVVTNSDFQQGLTSLLDKINPTSILWVTGRNSFENSSAYDFFLKMQQQYKYVTRVFDFSANPDVKDVIKLRKDANVSDVDLVISIGGGSVMDFAKLLIYFQYAESDEDVENLVKPTHSVNTIHIAIPTTSGSGSEATHFAVMYVDGKKHSIAAPFLLPYYVLLDASLTHSMNPYLTATSGFDAICQAIESVWAKNKNEESKKFALKALELLIPNFLKAVLYGEKEARKAMCLGAFYAGKAINISKTTGAHALAYYLTSSHGLAHGEAVGVNIDFFVQVNWKNMESADKKDLLHVFDCRNQNDFIDKLLSLKKQAGLKKSLKEIPQLSLGNYIAQVNLERMNNNPVRFSASELKEALMNYHQIG